MIKNKKSDIIFGIILVLFFINFLSGCGKDVATTKQYDSGAMNVSGGTSVEASTENDDVALGDNYTLTNDNGTKSETQTTAKSETKATAKTETQTTAKSETKATAKTETQTTAKSETKATAKSETKATAKSETQTTAKTETQATTKTETQTTAKTETQATAKTETQTTAKTETQTTAKTTTEAATPAFNSLKAISKITGLSATVENDLALCYVNTVDGHNPYDVTWDYGDEYQAYVDACDWSLVFDADYYISTFPILALQYHYDKDLLLEHFQTVGIHEGRQGSADFNVEAYLYNSNYSIYDTFKQTYEGYYFYYMLNYDTEKYVNTTSNEYDDYVITVQGKQVLTYLQAGELEGINGYRAEVDADNVKFNSELAAFANYRAYLNAAEGYKAHDWTRANYDIVWSLMADGCSKFSENTVTRSLNYEYCAKKGGHIEVENYRNSEDHYNTMVSTKYNYTGISNSYYGKNGNNQFDVFTDVADVKY